MESLKDKTAKGLFWGGMNNGVQQLLGLAFGIILGRLLDPSDYGMTAMLAVFSVIDHELQSSGFKTGLINLREPKHEDYNAVFWFNIVAGVVLYVALWFAAPLIADYYHEPKLIPLSRYVFLGFVFSSFGMAQSAYLTKQMQIKQIAKCGMTATLSSSLVSVAMAAMGFGYWALATQYLMYIAVNTILLWYFSPWRPSVSRKEEGGTRNENCFEADQTTPNRRLLHEDAIAYSGGEKPVYDSNYWLCTITLDPDLKVKGQENAYKEVIKTAVGGAAGVIHQVDSPVTDCQPNDNVEAMRVWMLGKKVECRPVWKPMHRQPVYEGAPAYTNGVEEDIFKIGMCLPAGPYVSDDDVKYIVDAIKEAII